MQTDKQVLSDESKYITSILRPSSVVCLDTARDHALEFFRSSIMERHDPLGQLSTMLGAYFGTLQARTLVANIPTLIWDTSHDLSLSIDPSVLYLLNDCPQLERFCAQIDCKIETDFWSLRSLQWLQSYMRAVTEVVAKTGSRLIRGGRETSTDLECFWAESRKSTESKGNREGVFYWRYTIERA